MSDETQAAKAAPTEVEPEESAGILDAAAVSLSDEIESLRLMLEGEGILDVALMVSGGALLVALIAALGRWLQREGVDTGHRVMRLTTMATVVAVLSIMGNVLVWFLERTPLMTLAVVFVLLVVLGLSGLTMLQNLLAGLGIALRGRLYPGVHVTIDGENGIVERVGATTVQVSTRGGAALHIPNSRFRKEAYATRAPHKTAQVALSFHLEEPVSDAQCRDAERAALLCPYRYFDSDVAVEVLGPRDRTLQVTFSAPSEAVARRAVRFMRKMLEERFREIP